MSTERERRAKELIEAGMESVQSGDIAEAMARFQQSLEVHPTAEGHTYYGWMLSFMDRYDEAIEECEKAIALDPDFGNPYNDIGSYYIQQGKLDEAIPWLERATRAVRYAPRHFPYMNLGRVFALKQQYGFALEHFRRALAIAPDDEQLQNTIEGLEQRLN